MTLTDVDARTNIMICISFQLLSHSHACGGRSMNHCIVDLSFSVVEDDTDCWDSLKGVCMYVCICYTDSKDNTTTLIR